MCERIPTQIDQTVLGSDTDTDEALDDSQTVHGEKKQKTMRYE